MFEAVLDFWFNEIEEAKWWVKDLAFDAEIKTRFADVHKAANAGELYAWRQSARGRLAEIIVLDQFSRNMYRDTPAAFASDSLALVLAQEAVAVGADTELEVKEQGFLYMPYMHSESLLIHDVALDLFAKTGDSNKVDFEKRHRDIIVQFGRYPHRNDILGRESSPEEQAFLQTPGSSF